MPVARGPRFARISPGPVQCPRQPGSLRVPCRRYSVISTAPLLYSHLNARCFPLAYPSILHPDAAERIVSLDTDNPAVANVLTTGLYAVCGWGRRSPRSTAASSKRNPKKKIKKSQPGEMAKSTNTLGSSTAATPSRNAAAPPPSSPRRTRPTNASYYSLESRLQSRHHRQTTTTTTP